MSSNYFLLHRHFKSGFWLVQQRGLRWQGLAQNDFKLRKHIQGDDLSCSFTLQIVSSDEYINPVLQNLCADALLSLSDEDSDWELNITEFMRCLDPRELEEYLHFNVRFARLHIKQSGFMSGVIVLCSQERHFLSTVALNCTKVYKREAGYNVIS